MANEAQNYVINLESTIIFSLSAALSIPLLYSNVKGRNSVTSVLYEKYFIFCETIQSQANF